MENAEPPICSSYGVALTVKHVLTECLQFPMNLYEMVGLDPDIIQNFCVSQDVQTQQTDLGTIS